MFRLFKVYINLWVKKIETKIKILHAVLLLRSAREEKPGPTCQFCRIFPDVSRGKKMQRHVEGADLLIQLRPLSDKKHHDPFNETL